MKRFEFVAAAKLKVVAGASDCCLVLRRADQSARDSGSALHWCSQNSLAGNRDQACNPWHFYFRRAPPTRLMCLRPNRVLRTGDRSRHWGYRRDFAEPKASFDEAVGGMAPSLATQCRETAGLVVHAKVSQGPAGTSAPQETLRGRSWLLGPSGATAPGRATARPASFDSAPAAEAPNRGLESRNWGRPVLGPD